MKFIKKFADIRITDIDLVGGKNASLGEMISQIKEIRVPDGFAITSQAYWYFIDHNNLRTFIVEQVASLGAHPTLDELHEVGSTVRTHILQGEMPLDLAQEIEQAYHALSRIYQSEACDVAVRSSATAEDLPSASFAGAQETFLNVYGVDQVLKACINCFSSLFTDRAIAYRAAQKIDQELVGLSIGIQKMVRSDKASSGVAFSLDTESGFKEVVLINSSYGLGESIVKGLVIPDEFVIHKPTFKQGYCSLIKKNLGSKKVKIVYGSSHAKKTVIKKVALADQKKFSLADNEVAELTRMVLYIEDYYSLRKGAWAPMDIEWAKDGHDNLIYIVQARPETVHARREKKYELTAYKLKNSSQKKVLTTGLSIGQHIATGTARIINTISQAKSLKEGEILITTMTDPDWVPVLKKAAGIITAQGGRTCHAAIVARELKIPALVGAQDILKTVHQGQKITMDCSQGSVGFVYDGIHAFEKKRIVLDEVPKVKTHLMVNAADPDQAFTLTNLPIDGIGLARIEFITSTMIKIHPLACIYPSSFHDTKIKKQIINLTQGYPTPRDFYVDTLARGIGMLAAAVYPKPVMVRTSDSKSNEYRNLLGGNYFEPSEENPMLGFRGAARYSDVHFQKAFALECAAIKKAREEFGLTNIVVLIPFVRTVSEGQKVISLMEKFGLKKGVNNLSLTMMCELPSNVLSIKEFSALFDGFSIGSNDLTQLILGVDRDSAAVAPIFNERDPAVLMMFNMAIKEGHACNRYVGICGQAPSDYPDIAHRLIKWGIDSISLNQDSIIPFFNEL